MAQDISLLGATYLGVPSVTLPKSGGGTASFTDVTDTTATASDVAAGKYFYTAAGVKTEGTASGGGGAISVVDTTDAAGGTIRTITAVDISDTTAIASDVASGKYFYTAAGVKTEGTASGGGGGGGDMSDPIRFFGYDGTLVASYTAVPGSLPSVPTHTGLKNGTWNHTLAEVTTQFNAMGTCDVGANYMTESEDSEIDIVLYDGRLDPYLSFAVNGTVEVDWGDNTTPETVTGTSLTSRIGVPHSYASKGAYTIKLHVVSGSMAFYASSTYPLLNKNSSTSYQNYVYSNAVKSVRVGNNTNIGTYAFTNCYSLESVSLPSGLTAIGSTAFRYCYSLRSISLPSTVTTIGNSAFRDCNALESFCLPSGLTSTGTYLVSDSHIIRRVSLPSGLTGALETATFNNCYGLESVTIPSGVTTLGNSCFSYCYRLSNITIPSGVTSIGNSAFANCYGMAEYHVKPTTPPTLGTTVFSNISSDCKIYVPSASLSDYQTAWSAYASYLVGE